MAVRMLSGLFLSLFFTGCALSSNQANVPSDVEELARLPALYSIEPRPIEATDEPHAGSLLGVDILEFSPDGNFLLVQSGIWVGRTPGRLYEWVQIHDARTGEQRHRVAIRDGEAGIGSGSSASGLLDSNAYYVSGFVEGMQFARVFDLHTHRELLAVNRVYTPRGSGDYLLWRNLRSPNLLRNWRTGEETTVVYFPHTMPQVTSGGAVLSTNREGLIAWHQPDEGDVVLFRSGMALVNPITTYSERYLVGSGKGGRCTVWSLPDAKQAGRCKRGIFSRLGFNTAYHGPVAAHPEREQVALSWGSRIKVYDLEPVRLIKEFELQGDVTDMVLHDDRLVVMTDETLQIWRMDRAQPVKLFALDRGSRHAISPDGSLLALFRSLRDDDSPQTARDRIDVYDLSQW